MPDQRFAFMLGTGRCGSTIVGQVVAMHDQVGFIANVDDRFAGLNRKGRMNNRIYRALPAPLQKQGGRRGGASGGRLASGVRSVAMTPSEGYRLLDRHVSPMLSAPVRDLVAEDASEWLSRRLRTFFERRAAAQGRPLFLHKFTGWPRAGLLHAVFPEARFVHVVRDGRAVACSLVQQPWWDGFSGPGGWSFGPLSDSDDALWHESGRSFTVLAGLEWKLLMQAFAEAQALVPAESWLELRYEDVVERPREQVQRLLDHLGLEWTAGFERSFAALEFAPDRAGAYRDELSAARRRDARPGAGAGAARPRIQRRRVTQEAATGRLQNLSLAGPAGLLLALVPVAAALRLTANGGGYTIDQWGIWGAATVIAAGVALVSQPVTRLSGVQRVLPLSLLGLALWSYASIHWAAWPQSALVEGNRYLVYSAAVTLVLVALPGQRWRRLLVAFVAACTALPALQVALQLWHSPNALARFEGGRLVAGVGYGGGLAAAVAIGFWPLVAFASDRSTPRPMRPLAAAGAGLVLATVVPTEARASVWALVLSAIVFFALCPSPIRSGSIAAGALLPTLGLWHQLNGVFASSGVSHAHTVGVSIMLVGLVAGTVGLAQVVLDELVTLPPVARRAVAVAALVWLVLVLALGSVAAFAVTDGHPVAWARHTLQRTVDRVGTEGGQAAGAGQAGSRFGSLDTGRYDLWKVAARGFRERPAEGFGAGNFGYLNVLIGHPFLFPYQAHSQLLEVAATLGFPGLALYLAALLLPIGACIWLRASGTQPKTDQLLAAGIGGALGYFAVHAQVDWIWQLSSCALPALLLAATAVAMLPPGRERPRSLVTGGAALLASVLAAALLIVPATLAQTLPGALLRGAGRRRPQRRAPCRAARPALRPPRPGHRPRAASHRRHRGRAGGRPPRGGRRAEVLGGLAGAGRDGGA